MKQTSKGRPQKYTDKELKDTLMVFMSKNPGNVNPLKLEKGTGIKRHVWSRRMGEEIKRLNKPTQTSNPKVLKNLPLPNVNELINKFGNNKKGLYDALQHLNEVIQSLYEKIQLQNDEIDTLKNTLERKKDDILHLTKVIAYYESQIVESTYSDTSKGGLKNKKKYENIISITDKNKEKALSFELEKNFPQLFSDK